MAMSFNELLENAKNKTNLLEDRFCNIRTDDPLEKRMTAHFYLLQSLIEDMENDQEDSYLMLDLEQKVALCESMIFEIKCFLRELRKKGHYMEDEGEVDLLMSELLVCICTIAANGIKVAV